VVALSSFAEAAVAGEIPALLGAEAAEPPSVGGSPATRELQTSFSKPPGDPPGQPATTSPNIKFDTNETPDCELELFGREDTAKAAEKKAGSSGQLAVSAKGAVAIDALGKAVERKTGQLGELAISAIQADAILKDTEEAMGGDMVDSVQCCPAFKFEPERWLARHKRDLEYLQGYCCVAKKWTKVRETAQALSETPKDVMDKLIAETPAEVQGQVEIMSGEKAKGNICKYREGACMVRHTILNTSMGIIFSPALESALKQFTNIGWKDVTKWDITTRCTCDP